MSTAQISLKRRILSAGSWTLAGYVLSSGIRLGSSLVMTRLLVPQMFGVMAIAMLVMTGLAMFSDLGIRQNIVQSKRGSDVAYLNTAWIIQIIRGVLLWLIGLCLSQVVLIANYFSIVPKGSVYADPILPYVIAVVSFSAVITGFQSTKLWEASRHLSLARVTQIKLASQIIGLFCMIGWVVVDRSIWALVAGSICSATLVAFLSHAWLPGVSNRWHWDQSAAHEILHFGKWMFLSSVLGFIANNADRILLGGFVDSATLGIYSIAFNFVGTIEQTLSRLIGEVSFSAFSEVARNQSLTLKRDLYRFHIVTASFAYSCSGLFVGAGGTLISLLYDPRYWQAGQMLQVLAFGLLAIPFTLAQYSLLALGLPRVFTNVIATRALLTIILIPIGFKLFGMPGALGGIVLSQLSSAPVTIYYQIKFNLFDMSKELLLLPLFVAGIVLGKCVALAIGP